MIFNDHSKLEGQHAFLGASKFRWMNWDDDTLEKRYYGQYAQQLGTSLHELADSLIKSRIRLNKSDRKIIDLHLYNSRIPKGAYNTEEVLLNMLPFVNDAIGFRMESEVILFYSYQAFGTADAILFNEKEKLLRIHDLKTGVSPTHMEQLIVYAALFCLEYRKKPQDITIILRIYQNFEIMEYTPDHMEVEKVMEMIKSRDLQVKQFLERDYRK